MIFGGFIEQFYMFAEHLIVSSLRHFILQSNSIKYLDEKKNKSNWMSKFKSWVGLRRKVNWVLHPPTCGCVNSYLDLQYEVDLNDLLSFTNYSLCLYPINFCNSEYIPISKILRKFRTRSELKYQQIADFHIKRAWTSKVLTTKTIYMISMSHPYVKLC